MHKIYLEQCRFKAKHGVFSEEKTIEGEFVVDVVLTTDFSKAASADDLEGTINYAEIYQVIEQEMLIPSRLLEHLADRVVNSIFKHSLQVKVVQLKVCKTHPPIKGEIGAVCVEIQESR